MRCRKCKRALAWKAGVWFCVNPMCDARGFTQAVGVDLAGMESDE